MGQAPKIIASANGYMNPPRTPRTCAAAVPACARA